MQNILIYNIFGNTVQQYLLFLGTIVLIELIAVSIGKLFFRSAKKLAAKTKNKIDDIVLLALERVVSLIGLMSGLSIGKTFLNTESVIATNFNVILIIAGTLIAASVLQQLTDSFTDEYLGSETRKKSFQQLAPVLRKLFRVTIWIIAFAIIVSNLGFDITSLLAGLGLGGLAFALAAQPTLSNFFASIAIFTDKPFNIGDFVKIGNVVGTIKEVGLRSTRIQTSDKTFVTIPNTKIAESVIENITKRLGVETHFTIGVVYNTSNKKLEQTIKIIKDVLKTHKQTMSGYRVQFASFGDFSLNIDVRYWIKNQDDYIKVLDIRSYINMKIKQQFEKAKIDFAFPTQTIELVKK